MTGGEVELVHPRETRPLEGVEAPTADFLVAMTRGRLHHAWLLCGPKGAGKASFAYAAARRLLGAEPDPSASPLASRPDDPVSRMVAAQSHPDLFTLEVGVGDGGTARKSIPVDEARRLAGFFAKSPAIARCRVAIVDAADDLNLNAANAILKTLEEPTGQGVLFLVSHAPGRLLATLRSRCRRLAFAPWPSAELEAFIVRRCGATADEARRLAELARGSPGRALDLAAAGALELDRQAGDWLARLPEIDAPALQALADGFRGGEGPRRFALVMERLGDRLRDAAAEAAAQGRLDTGRRWSEAWSRLDALPAQVEALNLDRADAFWTAIADLREAARRTC